MSKTTIKINSRKNILLLIVSLGLVATLAQLIIIFKNFLSLNRPAEQIADPVTVQLQTIQKAYDKLNDQTISN